MNGPIGDLKKYVGKAASKVKEAAKKRFGGEKHDEDEIKTLADVKECLDSHVPVFVHKYDIQLYNKGGDDMRG